MKKISLGIDIGTSKICISEFEIDSKRWGFLDCEGKEVFPSTYKIPDSEIVIESTKRCVFCEMSIHEAMEKIPLADCTNPKNFHNKRWCREGKRNFMVGDSEWQPTCLFKAHLADVLEKVQKRLEEKYGDYRILEVKAGVPMIFNKGEWFVSWITSHIFQIAKNKLGNKFGKDCTVTVIEEPIASFMSYAYEQPRAMSHGLLLIVDVGAGTTDIALCEQKGPRLAIIESDSINIAGDDYDIAIKEQFLDRAIKKAGVDIQNEMRWSYARQLKEDFCRTQTPPTLTLPKIAPITIKIDQIKALFKPIDSEIYSWLKSFLNKCGVADKVNKVYLTGGGINVPSLRSSISQLMERPRDVVELEINEPDITRLDHKIASVAAGAAIPQREYMKIIKFMLPGLLVIDKKHSGDTYIQSGLLYSYKRSHSSGSTILKKVDRDATYIIRFINKGGEKRTLIDISARRYYKERSHRKPLNLKIEYTIEYNGKLKIVLFSNHRPKKETIYDAFVPI